MSAAAVASSEKPLMGTLPRVVILGAGFAGLQCAKKLSKTAVEITIVDRNNCNVFQPLLYQVALAALSPSQIAAPVRAVLRNAKNTTVLMDEVTGVNSSEKQVFLASGTTLTYDYLVVATGSEKSYFGHPEWEDFAPGLKTVDDALEIRRRILLAFEEAELQAVRTGNHKPLHFLVVGGGPTGVELAGAVAEMVHYFLRNNFRNIDVAESKIVLLDGSPRILTAYPPDLSVSAVKQLNKLGVEVHNNVQVQEIGDGFVKAADGMVWYSAVTMWGAGVATSPVAGMLGVPLDRKGRVIVDERLNPRDRPEVFACGDVAVFVKDGKELPGVAQPALQMGSFAADCIRRDTTGRARDVFHFFDKGTIATIGRYSAVGDIHWPLRAQWSGLIAWLTWLAVHITFLLNFRNRLAVLWELTSSYLLLVKDDRLIVSDNRPTSRAVDRVGQVSPATVQGSMN